MDATRRDVLTAAGATAAHDLAHAEDHDHQDVPSDVALRVKSLESLLVEKKIVDRAALDALVDTYEHKVGPRNGARVVARAWVDPAYKQRLLASGTAAIGELGYSGNQGADIRVVENIAKVHNFVVCTLCSCYPWPVLGLPPVWYKAAPYRSRAVIDPRGVLRELGLELPADVEVRAAVAQPLGALVPLGMGGVLGVAEQAADGLVARFQGGVCLGQGGAFTFGWHSDRTAHH
jgi:nitrile hydratase